MNYLTNIIYDTAENQNFRTVLHTGMKSQLVVMSIPPGGEIGMETHERVEQTLFFLQGNGIAILNGKKRAVNPGDALVVTPGTEHNVVNTGSAPLKIYTIYAPPNHLDGRVHPTKADADRDDEDEAFGSAIALGLHTNGKAVATPGFLPDIEPRPEPSSPWENQDSPPLSIHDEISPTLANMRTTLTADAAIRA